MRDTQTVDLIARTKIIQTTNKLRLHFVIRQLNQEYQSGIKCGEKVESRNFVLMFVSQLQDSLLFVHFPLQTENLLKSGRSLSDQLTA